MTLVYRVGYIAGTGRSGSTLVAQCLARSTRAVHVGEVRYLWDRGVGENHLCECGAPFRDCPFWAEVLATAYGDAAPSVARRVRALAPAVDRMRRIPQTLVRRGGGFRAGLREYGELVVPLYDALAAVAGADLVLDSSKDPSYLFALSAMDALDVRAVHLVRDSRAVAYSWTRQRLRPEIHWQAQYMNTRTPRRTALIWAEYNAAVELYRSRRGIAARVRYEDFVQDPDAAVRSLAAALESPVPAGSIGSGAGHSLSGNPMRFDRAPLVVRADTEWMAGLPRRDQRVVTALTLPLLRRYGYPLRGTRQEQPCASS